jgi:hypothetical protein
MSFPRDDFVVRRAPRLAPTIAGRKKRLGSLWARARTLTLLYTLHVTPTPVRVGRLCASWAGITQTVNKFLHAETVRTTRIRLVWTHVDLRAYRKPSSGAARA